MCHSGKNVCVSKCTSVCVCVSLSGSCSRRRQRCEESSLKIKGRAERIQNSAPTWSANSPVLRSEHNHLLHKGGEARTQTWINTNIYTQTYVLYKSEMPKMNTFVQQVIFSNGIVQNKILPSATPQMILSTYRVLKNVSACKYIVWKNTYRWIHLFQEKRGQENQR